MSSQAPQCSPTLGRAIAGSIASDTSTIGVASGLHGPAERIRARSCLGCTGSHPLPSGGCSVPTRGLQTRPTLPPTWTSSCSASTAASPAVEGCSSIGYASSPSDMIPCGTATSPPVRNHGRCYLHRRGQGGTHQAWIVPHWTDLGEPSTSTTPVKGRARTRLPQNVGSRTCRKGQLTWCVAHGGAEVACYYRIRPGGDPVSYTHLRAHETDSYL